MRAKFKAGLVMMFLFFGMTGMANAALTTLTTNVRVDNGYEIFLSTSDSVAGTKFGEFNNWQYPHSLTVGLVAGTDYYLHVYGYNQGGPEGFLGEFKLDGTNHVFSNGSNTLLTNIVDWKVNATGWNGSYSAPFEHGVNDGSSPFWGGPYNDIPTTASWIWTPRLNGYWVDPEVYFSTKITATTNPVPVPSAILFLGSGILGLAGVSRRKK